MGALDPMVRAELQADLRAIFRSLEKTVVMVTHDLAEAGWFGDEILLMRDGRIVQRGTIRALLDEPAEPFVTQFVSAQRQVVGSPAEGTHDDRPRRPRRARARWRQSPRRPSGSGRRRSPNR